MQTYICDLCGAHNAVSSALVSGRDVSKSQQPVKRVDEGEAGLDVDVVVSLVTGRDRKPVYGADLCKDCQKRLTTVAEKAAKELKADKLEKRVDGIFCPKCKEEILPGDLGVCPMCETRINTYSPE